MGGIDANEWLYKELKWSGFRDAPTGFSKEHLGTLCDIGNDPPFSQPTFGH
jgi:hypothetical protein